MANEPNNNAEEQVKQYAADRRQMAPREIHPATRNVLQGEVARTYGSPQEERRARLRLRWLQALAWIAILAAIPFFLMPRNPDAKKVQEATPSAPNEVTLPSAKKDGEAPIVLSDTKTPVTPPVLTPVAPPKSVAPAQAPAPAPVRERDEAAAAAPEARVLKMKSEGLEAAQTPVAARAAASTDVDANNNLRLMFANNVQNQQILNQFQFEQTGARLKITEPDGSVYPGRVLTNGAFNAAGYNKTLKKPLIFTGQVMRASIANVAQQQVQAQTATANSAPAQNRAYANNSSANNLSNLNNNSEEVRLQGQAISGNNQYKVDAQLQLAPGK